MADENCPEAEDVNNEDVGSPESEPTKGLLLKKGKRSANWKLVFAKIEGNNILYGNKAKEQSLTKSIMLSGAVIKDLEEEKGKPNHFTIKPKNNSRTYYFSTRNVEEHQKWLQAICIARMTDNSKSQNSEACVLQ